MTTYTTIPNADIDVDSPITTSLMTLMRDNPTAITEGATGAPRIQRAAFDSKVLLKWLYDFGDGSDGAQAWTTAGSPYATGLWQCTTFSIAAGQVATLSPRGTLIIMAQTSITITGTLNHDGGGGEGAWTNSSSNTNVLYGGHGGAGMYGGSGGGANGAAGHYGGSGGDVLFARGGDAGGAGAAQSTRVKTTLQLLTPGILSTSIRHGAAVNGWAGGGQSSTGGGGGGGYSGSTTVAARPGSGGGLIIMISPTITLQTGSFIYARGTAAGTNAGGGGGGGCVIAATPAGGYSNSGTITTSGGAGSNGGAGGAGWSANFTI